MNRDEILAAAVALVSVDRQRQHGDARLQWCRIAAMWSAFLGVPISPAEALRMMAQMKGVRAQGNPALADSGLDAVGYEVLAAEADAQGWGRAPDFNTGPAMFKSDRPVGANFMGLDE